MKHVAAVFSSRPQIGGSFQYSQSVWTALKHLADAGWHVSVVCLNEEWSHIVAGDGFSTDSREERLLARLCRRALLGLPGGVRGWQRVGRFVSSPLEALNRLRPDLVLFPCEPYQALGTRLPFLAPIHDLMYIYENRFPEVGEKRRAVRRRFVDTNVCRYARGVLVDSRVGKDHVLENFDIDPARVHILPYVAPPVTSGPPPSSADVPFGRFVIYPAQLWEHKNHVGLLRALASLLAQGVRVNCVLTGGVKNGAAAIFSEIDRLGLREQVRYLGYVDPATLGALYREAQALVMPSYFGPTNIPPLEAFTFGCPVAAAAVYGVPEQLGQAAIYFDPTDEHDIAAAVRRLWCDEDLRSQLAANGRKWLKAWNQTNFSIRLGEIVELATYQ